MATNEKFGQDLTEKKTDTIIGENRYTFPGNSMRPRGNG
ncbi:MAG: hypothetical protein CM15mV143_010 [Caudoviricetes sp.]|nr:MAG: hypothetical protein CM15mV143_010 [Caudoviricetes sp.]